MVELRKGLDGRSRRFWFALTVVVLPATALIVAEEMSAQADIPYPDSLQAQQVEEAAESSVPSSGVYIGDPIVLEQSDEIGHALFDEDNHFNYYVFNLSGTPLVEDGEFNDLLLEYITGEGTNTIWVLNRKPPVSKESWDKLAEEAHPWSGVSIHHLFSARGLDAGKYVDPDTFELKIRTTKDILPVPRPGYPVPDPPYLSITALRLNPRYSAIPLRDIRCNGGFVHDGTDSIWLASNDDWKIYNLSMSGEILGEFNAPDRFSYFQDPYPNFWSNILSSLTIDDSGHLWLLSTNNDSDEYRGNVFKLSKEGEVLDHFSIPASSVDNQYINHALAWLGQKLWIAVEGDKIIGIDPARSCSEGVAYFRDRDKFPLLVDNGPYCVWGLTPYKGDLLVGTKWCGIMFMDRVYPENNRLHRISTNGVTKRVCDLSFLRVGLYSFYRYWDITDISVDEHGILIMNPGFMNADLITPFNADPVISRFIMPPKSADLDEDDRVDYEDLYLLQKQWHTESR